MELRLSARGVDAMTANDDQQVSCSVNWLAAAAEVWGQMYAIHDVPVVDGLLVATAKVHNLTLVTRNITDVQDLGISLLNPCNG